MSTVAANNPPMPNNPPAPIVAQGQPPAREKTEIAQKILLVATVASAVISLVPPLRLAGSILIRSVALLSSSLRCRTQWDQSTSNIDRFLKGAKIVVITAGLVGVAASVPFLIVGSIIADLAINLFEACKAFYNKDIGKGLIHLTMAVIDSLALSAIIAGSWQCMVAAAAVSAAAMGVLIFVAGHNVKRSSDILDVICYVALTGIGIATAVTTAEIWAPAKVTFEVRNNTSKPMNFYNKRGELLVTLQPGERRSFDVPTVDTKRNFFGDRFIYSDARGGKWVEHARDNWSEGGIITQHALEPGLFPTLPVGGTNISTNIIS